MDQGHDTRPGRPAGEGALTALAGGPHPDEAGGAAAAAARQRRAQQPIPHGTLSVADIAGAQPARKMVREGRQGPQQQAPADAGMQPQRYTHERTRGPADLHLSAPAAIPGAQAGRPRQRAHPFNPLDPQYRWYEERQEAAPPLKFVRDAMDVSDIAGARAEPSARAPRGVPSTMQAGDIEGAAPGWRPHALFAAQPRDPLRLLDIDTRKQGPRQRQPARSPSEPAGDGDGGSPAAAAVLTARPATVGWERLADGGQEAAPDYGVANTVEWRKQRAAGKLQQAEAARQARAAADAAIAQAAAQAAAAARSPPAQAAAGASHASGAEAFGLTGMLRSIRALDREGCGRVQAAGLAAAMQQSALGLSPREVQGLVARVQDSHGSVEYRPLVAKLWGHLQQQGAVPAPRGGSPAAPAAASAPSAGRGGGGGGGGAPPAQPPAVHLPQFVAARQRRLQTNVALALHQQPEATAGEAAGVAALPGFLPWKQPQAAAFGKRMAYERPAELGTTPASTFSFAGGDPRAAEAALQWRASKAASCAAAPWRGSQPPKQASSHHTPPADDQIRAVHAQPPVHGSPPPAALAPAAAARLGPPGAGSAAPQLPQHRAMSAGVVQQAAVPGALPPRVGSASCWSPGAPPALHRLEAAIAPLAAQAADQEERALLQSLN